MKDENDVKRRYSDKGASNFRISEEDLHMAYSKNRVRRKSRRRMLGVALVLLFALIVLFAIISAAFFRVSEITVTGNTIYSGESILANAGIEEGMNLFAVNGRAVSENIRAAIPGVNKVKTVKHFPNRIELCVEETVPVYFLAVGEYFYTLDESLLVLQKLDGYEDVEAMDLVRVFVPGVERCMVGEKIRLSDADIADMLSTLYNEIKNWKLVGSVDSIDMTDKFNITFTLYKKYEVILGSIVDCGTKLEFLCGITDKLGDHDIGTIDLSDEDIRKATFARS